MEFLKTFCFRLSSLADFNAPFEFLCRTDYPDFFLSLKENTTEAQLEQMLLDLDGKKSWVCKNRVRNKARGFLKLMRNIRIGCFSEVNDNPLMWSHYARKHTGLLVSFNTSFLQWGNDFHKVNYSETPVYVDLFDEKNMVCTKEERELFIRKSLCWEYEKEWRYIKSINECERDDKGYFKSVRLESISEIVLGCKMKKEHCDEIKALRKERFPKVPVYCACPGRCSYSLIINSMGE